MADIEYKLHHVEIVEKALLIMFQEIGNESKECSGTTIILSLYGAAAGTL